MRGHNSYSYSFIIFAQGCLNQLSTILTQGPAFTTYYKCVNPYVTLWVCMETEDLSFIDTA